MAKFLEQKTKITQQNKTSTNFCIVQIINTRNTIKYQKFSPPFFEKKNTFGFEQFRELFIALSHYYWQNNKLLINTIRNVIRRLEFHIPTYAHYIFEQEDRKANNIIGE